MMPRGREPSPGLFFYLRVFRDVKVSPLPSTNVDHAISGNLKRADDLMKAGRSAEAVSVYRKLVQDCPEEDSHLLALAWALHDSGDKREAIACFEQLFGRELARGLFTGFAYDELVRLHREGNDGKALVSVCERAAAAQPEDVGILQTLGEAYLSTGMAAEAAALFGKLTEREPDAPGYWCSLGDARLAGRDPDGAEAAYNRAAENDPATKAVFLSRLAEGLMRVGHLERARTVWERSLKACSKEPFCWTGLGDCLVCLGKPAAAAEAYRRAIELRPASAAAFWHRLGQGLVREGLHSLATEAFTEAVAAAPEDPFHMLRLAQSYAAQGQNELAEKTIRRAKTKKCRPAQN